MSSPNRDALVRIAGILGAMTGELVFVGGRVTELLVTEPGTTRVRPTDDSDAICQVATRTEYHHFGERLRAVGFREDQTPGAPICRWRHAEDVLDVMSVDGDLLGFRNNWYPHAVRLASDFEVAPGVVIRIAPAPVFLATKWDAFNDRGAGDWYGSHDIEDIVTVVAGRPELLDELVETAGEVRQYVARHARTLLASGLAEGVVAGALPDARLIPHLVDRTLERFETISRLQAAE